MSFNDPSDAEQDEFLNDLMGEDDSESSDEADDGDESTDERDDHSPSEGDDGDQSDDEADDDDELAGLDEQPTDAIPTAVQQQLAQLQQAVLIQQRQVQQQQRAYEVLGRLRTIRDDYISKDDEPGWNTFQTKLVGGFKDHLLQNALGALQQFGEQTRQARLADAEGQAQQAAIEHFNTKFNGFSNTERLTLRMTRTPDEFMAALRTIKADRKAQTEPARRELRQRREQFRADAGGARNRGNGGGRGSADNNYNNFRDLDAYLDDVLSA